MTLTITIDLDRATNPEQLDGTKLIDLEYTTSMAVLDALSCMKRPDVDKWGPCKNMLKQTCGEWRIES